MGIPLSDFVLVWTMITTVPSIQGLRTCVDVQNTLMACIFSSDVDFGDLSGQQKHMDAAEFCWEASVLLECVVDARSTCPNLPLLSDPDFLYGVRSLHAESEAHCPTLSESTSGEAMQTTSSSMIRDQAAEPCDAMAAMIKCNDIMGDVNAGDIQAMCIPGGDYLACLSHIVDTCPSQVEALPFDLQKAIDTTRSLLERECPSIEDEEECAEKIENAKRECADFLTNGEGDYCRSLKTYLDCLDIVLMTCPDPDLESMLTDQYQHHCVKAMPSESKEYGASSKCPDDAEAAMMECNSYVHGADPSDRAALCRKSQKYFSCLESLLEKCHNDPRFSPDDFTRQAKQQMHALCDHRDNGDEHISHGHEPYTPSAMRSHEALREQPRARTRYPLRTHNQHHFP